MQLICGSGRLRPDANNVQAEVHGKLQPLPIRREHLRLHALRGSQTQPVAQAQAQVAAGRAQPAGLRAVGGSAGDDLVAQLVEQLPNGRPLATPVQRAADHLGLVGCSYQAALRLQGLGYQLLAWMSSSAADGEPLGAKL